MWITVRPLNSDASVPDYFVMQFYFEWHQQLSLLFPCTITEQGEGLQVLHYEVGQKYEPHFDYFHDDYNTKNGGQRIATLLMYLYVLHCWYCTICAIGDPIVQLTFSMAIVIY